MRVRDDHRCYVQRPTQHWSSSTLAHMCSESSLGGSQHQSAVFGLTTSSNTLLPTSRRVPTSHSSSTCAMGTRTLAPIAASTFHPYEKKMQQAAGLDPLETEAMGTRLFNVQEVALPLCASVLGPRTTRGNWHGTHCAKPGKLARRSTCCQVLHTNNMQHSEAHIWHAVRCVLSVVPLARSEVCLAAENSKLAVRLTSLLTNVCKLIHSAAGQAKL